jgi:hypothetical protein
MTLNSLQPAPTDQRPVEGGSTFVFPQLDAGGTLTVWFEWSVNPTNVAWMRPETIRVNDGDQSLLTYRTTVTVFP